MQRSIPVNPPSELDDNDDDKPYGLHIKNPIPIDPISLSRITDLPDPILFQDGHIYSYKELNDYLERSKAKSAIEQGEHEDKKAEAVRSPMTNEEVKSIIISSNNYALKDFLATFNELKAKCENTLKENIQMILVKDSAFLRKLDEVERLDSECVTLNKKLQDNLTLEKKLESNIEAYEAKQLTLQAPSISLSSSIVTKAKVPDVKKRSIDVPARYEGQGDEQRKFQTKLVLKNEIPRDLISRDPINEVADPICFQDGQFYSYILLNTWLGQHNNKSPYTNLEVQPQLISSHNSALKDLIASFHELRQIHADLCEENSLLQKDPSKPLWMVNRLAPLLQENDRLREELESSARRIKQLQEVEKFEIDRLHEMERAAQIIKQKQLDLQKKAERERKAIEFTLQSQKSLAIISTPEDIMLASQASIAAGKGPVKLAESTVASMEIMQNQDYLDKFQSSKPLDGGELLEEITKYFEKYEVPIGLINKLLALTEYRLNFIIDDSGSMNENSDLRIADASPIVQLRNKSVRNPTACVTRWQEAEDRLHVLMNMLAYIPTHKIKISFFNRDTVLELTHEGKTPAEFINEAHAKIKQLFDIPPSGITPLCSKLSKSFAESKESTMHYVFTDGQPSDASVVEVTELVKKRSKPHMNPINFISCTNVNEDTEWMKEVEEVADFVSVLDGFNSEREEIKIHQGITFPYTKGFWLVSQLVAAINQYDLDALYESTPLSKYTLDNLLGRKLTDKEYRYYFDNNPNTKQFLACYDKLATEQTHAKRIIESIKSSIKRYSLFSSIGLHSQSASYDLYRNNSMDAHTQPADTKPFHARK